MFNVLQMTSKSQVKYKTLEKAFKIINQYS